METPESIEAMGRAVDKLITDVHALKSSNPTLRDQFAMVALNGCLSYSAVNPMSGNYHENCTCDNAAQAAYGYADAMMKAREAA